MGYNLKKIAIQGVQGSFHEIAAIEHFGKAIETVDCDSFDALFESLDKGLADFGLMAIENSVAGTILPNYALLRESAFSVIGEVFLRIEHHLMCLPEENLEDISKVSSHQMALLQCGHFFQTHKHIKRQKANDTAESAYELATFKQKGHAVIASERAAELYGLKIIKRNIEDDSRNFTRFLVLERSSKITFQPNANKASLSFRLAHETGSLATVLIVLAGYKMNLTKIQSLPVIGKEWVYHFHLDMEFNTPSEFETALKTIEPMISQLKILGIYTKSYQSKATEAEPA